MMVVVLVVMMMIHDIGAPVSIAGVSWMKQYLEEFNLEIEDMKSVSCSQPFVFGPSKRYVSTSLVELPILVTRMDGKEDVLIVQTYLVDAEVPFLCGKQTLETWNFKIDEQEMILEIQLTTGQVNGRKLLKLEKTTGGYYGIVLELGKKKNTKLFLVKEDSGILFKEDKEEDLCPFRAVRKVHELNRVKGKEQLLAAYRNAGWISPGLANIIDYVVNNCKVCQKFQKSVARRRVTLPKAPSFNEVVTLDIKEFGS